MKVYFCVTFVFVCLNVLRSKEREKPLLQPNEGEEGVSDAYLTFV